VTALLLDVSKVRELLGVRYCPTCEQDALILDSGYCPWCLTNPETGERDFAEMAKDRADRERARMRNNSKAYRERMKLRCLECGERLEGTRRKFCSDPCMRDWWRKKQNDERRVA